MGTAPVFASVSEAMDMVRAGLAFMASADATTVGAVSAATVQRYIDTQYERPWRKERGR